MNTLGNLSSDSNDSAFNHMKSDYSYPEWYNSRTHKFYKKLYKRINDLVEVHNASSNYFSKMQKYIFGPSILITCLSGIGSFLSTSELVKENSQNIFGITVGVLTSISTLLQSLGSAYRFSAKEDAHRMAAEEYNKLGVKLKFEMEMPNEEDFADNLENKILEIQNKCNYFAPQHIVENIKKKNCQIHERKTTANVKIINDEDEPLLNKNSLTESIMEHNELAITISGDVQTEV
jgi:hypothetical protein